MQPRLQTPWSRTVHSGRLRRDRHCQRATPTLPTERPRTGRPSSTTVCLDVLHAVTCCAPAYTFTQVAVAQVDAEQCCAFAFVADKMLHRQVHEGLSSLAWLLIRKPLHASRIAGAPAVPDTGRRSEILASPCPCAVSSSQNRTSFQNSGPSGMGINLSHAIIRSALFPHHLHDAQACPDHPHGQLQGTRLLDCIVRVDALGSRLFGSWIAGWGPDTALPRRVHNVPLSTASKLIPDQVMERLYSSSSDSSSDAGSVWPSREQQFNIECEADRIALHCPHIQVQQATHLVLRAWHQITCKSCARLAHAHAQGSTTGCTQPPVGVTERAATHPPATAVEQGHSDARRVRPRYHTDHPTACHLMPPNVRVPQATGARTCRTGARALESRLMMLCHQGTSCSYCTAPANGARSSWLHTQSPAAPYEFGPQYPFTPQV